MTRPLLKFFSLSFAAAWICWIAAGAISHRSDPGDPALATLVGALFLVGTFSPGLIALALTERADGRAGTRALFRQIFKWKVGARWYVFALAYIPAIKVLVALMYRIITGAWPPFGQEPLYIMAAALLISTWAQAGEEIGWRGYALPRLSDRFGLAPASVILGMIWASWHLPFFFLPQSDTFGQSFPLYLLQVTAVAVAMAWLYWRTNGSLLLVMLLHAAVNNLKDIVPSAEPGATNPFALSHSLVAWLTVAFLWIAAAYFLARMHKTSSSALAGAQATV